MATSPRSSQTDSGPRERTEVSNLGIHVAKGCSYPGDPAGGEGVKVTSSPETGSAAADVQHKPHHISGHPVRVVDQGTNHESGLLCRKPPNKIRQALDESDMWNLSAVTKKENVTQDKMDSQEDDLSPVYNPDSDGENNPWFAPDSPSTVQKKVENTRKAYMNKASHALKYYHTSYPGECYTPEHVNLKHVIFMLDTIGYYIHMNFTARNMKDGAEKIFFAELRLPYEDPINEWVVTACDIVGPESLGGLRHVWQPNGIRFTGNTKDVKNCYACDDFIKHIDGSMYEAGHRGHAAYEVTDISVE